MTVLNITINSHVTIEGNLPLKVEDYLYKRLISAQKFSFIYPNGKWLYQNTDYRHRYTTKILSLLQQEYSIGSLVYPSDRKLIGALIGKWNETFEKELEKEFGEKESGCDINQEMLDFISNDLKQRVG
ncbi:hypothetical protein DRN75_04195, partial [Nanoarchaeota archaeon]